jgi:hypothetical protein
MRKLSLVGEERKKEKEDPWNHTFIKVHGVLSYAFS